MHLKAPNTLSKTTVRKERAEEHRGMTFPSASFQQKLVPRFKNNTNLCPALISRTRNCALIPNKTPFVYHEKLSHKITDVLLRLTHRSRQFHSAFSLERTQTLLERRYHWLFVYCYRTQRDQCTRNSCWGRVNVPVVRQCNTGCK